MDAYDLHVHVAKSRGVKELEKICKLAMELGFTGLAVETPLSLPEDLAQELLLLRRVTLSLPNAARLHSLATQQQRRADLLAVHGRTKTICMSAAKASSVDLITLRDLGDFNIFNSRIAHTLAKQGKPVEICLSGLLLFHGSRRSRMMHSMAQTMEHVLHAGCPLILTSGATDPYGLRSPRDLAALALLAGVPEDLAKKGVYDIPAALVTRLMSRQANCRGSPQTLTEP